MTGMGVSVGLGAAADEGNGAAEAETSLVGEPWGAGSTDGCPQAARATAAISAPRAAAPHSLTSRG